MKFFLPASSFGDHLGIETGKLAIQYGFDGVELWGDGLLLLSEIDIENAYEFYKKVDLELSVHLPYIDLNIASVNPDIRRVSLDLNLKALITARRIGAKFAVTHTGKNSGIKTANFQIINMSSSIDSLYRLSQIATMLGMKLLLENGIKKEIGSTLKDFLSIINDLKDIYVCLDVGHANIMKWDVEKICNIKQRIKCTHVHDNNGKYDQHKSIGKGSINWTHWVGLLRKANNIVLEIRNFTGITDFIESRETLRELLSS